MNYLTALAIPLFAITSAPAYADNNQAPHEPAQRTAQKLQENAGSGAPEGSSAGTSSGAPDTASEARAKQAKLLFVETLKAAATNGPREPSQSPALKPRPATRADFAQRIAIMISMLDRDRLMNKLSAEQTQRFADAFKGYLEASETKYDAVHFDRLGIPAFGLSDEEARAAGYPCFGPDDATVAGNQLAPERVAAARARVADMMARATVAAHRIGTEAAVKNKEQHAKLHATGEPCDDCPDCADAACTEAAHIATKAKDFDCVDCPEHAIA